MSGMPPVGPDDASEGSYVEKLIQGTLDFTVYTDDEEEDMEDAYVGSLQMFLTGIPKDNKRAFVRLVQSLYDELPDNYKKLELGDSALEFWFPDYGIPQEAMDTLVQFMSTKITLTSHINLWLKSPITDGSTSIWEFLQGVNKNNENGGCLECVNIYIDEESESRDFPLLVGPPTDSERSSNAKPTFVHTFPKLLIRELSSDFSADNIKPLLEGAANPDSRLSTLVLDFNDFVEPGEIKCGLGSVLEFLAKLPADTALNELELRFNGFYRSQTTAKNLQAFAKHIGNIKSLTSLAIQWDDAPYKLSEIDQHYLVYGLLQNKTLETVKIRDLEYPDQELEKFLKWYALRNQMIASGEFLEPEEMSESDILKACEEIKRLANNLPASNVDLDNE